MLIQTMIVYPGPSIVSNSIPSIWGPEKMAIDFQRLAVSRLFAFTDFPCCILCHTEYESHSTCIFVINVQRQSFTAWKTFPFPFYKIHYGDGCLAGSGEQRADAFKDSPTVWAT